MSDGITRDYSFTVRFSADERTALEALAAQWQLDKSATVRRALQMALKRQRLPERGHFVALQPEVVSFPVRLSGKGSHDG
ncbi:MAG: hypothetical protein CL607_18245 [Anaerolineaceae bacterium]|nr:hypothetical protein [Anaerolineaceae bacterium]